jgi:hypothetical protein
MRERWRRTSRCTWLLMLDLSRRPLTFVLIGGLPVLFALVGGATTPSRPGEVKVALLVDPEAMSRRTHRFVLDVLDDGVRTLDRRAVALTFLGVAAVGFVSAFFAFYLVHRRLDTDRRLALVGLPPVEIGAAKLAVLSALVITLSAYQLALLLAIEPVAHPPGLLAGLVAVGLVYGGVGLLLGAVSRHEIEGLLAIVLLANIDVGWLQNPAYYGESQRRWIIESLPGFFPTQLAMLSVFEPRGLAEAAGRCSLWVAAAFLAALAAILVRTRRRA